MRVCQFAVVANAVVYGEVMICEFQEFGGLLYCLGGQD